MRLKLPARLLGVLLLLPITSCGDGLVVPGQSAPAGEYIASLGPWAAFSPLRASVDSVLPNTDEAFDEIFDGVTYTCNAEDYELTETPDKIVTFDPDANVLWLGALLQGSGYKEGIGSLQELIIRERAPLRVSIDLLSGNNHRLVRNPTPASVGGAIGEMVEEATAAGLRGGSSISFSQQQTYSVQQAALALGLSAAYMSVSIATSLEASRKVSEKTLTAYFVQRMFTASIELPASPGDVFSDAFTPEKLEAQRTAGTIGSDNLPVYVANVVYGRILSFSFTSSAQEAKIRAALSASFGGVGGAELSAELLNILQEASIRVVAIGGEGKNALALIQTGKLESYFADDAALTSARPISYTIRNLSDNSIAKVSETTRYRLRECAARPTTGRLSIDVTPNSATVDVAGPNGYRLAQTTGDQLLTELQPGGYSITMTTSQGSITRDTVVVAGETVEMYMALGDPIGGAFRITLQDVNWLQPEGVLVVADCIGGLEGDPEAYWNFSIAGDDNFPQNRPEANAIQIERNNIPLRVALGMNKTLDVLNGATVRIQGSFYDQDPDANDLMGTWDFTVNPNSIGTANGSRTSRLQIIQPFSRAACVMRLDYRIEFLRPIYE